MIGPTEASRLSMGNRMIQVAVLLLLGVCASTILWYQVARISLHADINYNEGWNTYRAQMAGSGAMLYGKSPLYTITNYPPLSFHLVSYLGKLTGNLNTAGRWISLTSLAVLSLLIVMMVREFTGQWLMGAYAALFFVTGLAVILPDRIGMNDPQILGLACSAAGLYFYMRSTPSNRFLILSGLAFAISLFIKHNLLAFPCAAGVHLLAGRAWKRFATWAGTLAVLCGLLLLMTLLWDGSHFWSHLLAPRVYSFWRGWAADIVPYLLIFQIAMAAALIWSILNVTSGMRKLLVIAFVLANIIGFALAGGEGVDSNVLLDGLAITAVMMAIGIAELQPRLIDLKWSGVIFLLVLLVPYVGILAVFPARRHESVQSWRSRGERDAQFARAVEFLRSRPGPALCENLLLCYEAGKPNIYDPFFVNDQMKIGRISEAEVSGIIRKEFFQTLEIAIARDELLAPSARLRFSEPLMRNILEHYTPALRGDDYVFLIPKENPGRP